MVGVLTDYRDCGVGRSLKLAQRNDALIRHMDLIEWTFDPLQLKNAHFNIARLGAIVRRYIPDLYGRTTSPLHGGLPTDRLVAEWWVSCSRVRDLLDGTPQRPPSVRERITIPANIRDICRRGPQTAERVQSQVRSRFEYWIAQGYAVTGFEFKDNEGHYLLEPYED
jgi:predicted GNAT superfamily acetyltransferase